VEDGNVVRAEDDLLSLAGLHTLQVQQQLGNILRIVIAILLVKAGVLEDHLGAIAKQMAIQRNTVMAAERLGLMDGQLHFTALPAIDGISSQVQQVRNLLRPMGWIGNPRSNFLK